MSTFTEKTELKKIGNWTFSIKMSRLDETMNSLQFEVMLYCNLNNTLIKYNTRLDKVFDRKIPPTVQKWYTDNQSKIRALLACMDAYDSLTMAIQLSWGEESQQRYQFSYNYHLGKVDFKFSPALINSQYQIYKIQRRH